ncbi:MAG: MarR family winged helix-turn-helix transcriptional regulator [Candidatus Omnitrophica bacterium]|nr:MarR family winged helix-turn-helix transcriptional regulator [Candidatus Omnitrophota bacterium]
MNIKEFASKVIELSPQIIRGFKQYENNYLTRGEITLPQFCALGYLGSNGKSKMNTLAKHLKISPAASTGLIDRLMAQKLVIRMADSGDRRIVWIELTAKGREIIKNINKQKTETLIRVFGKISPKDREHYLNILQQVVKITASLPDRKSQLIKY